MSIVSVPRIFFVTVLFAAAILIASYAHATTTAIDSALNNSLQDSKELNQELGKEENQNFVAHKVKSRQSVEINLDEADADKAATYKDVQANGDVRENKY